MTADATTNDDQRDLDSVVRDLAATLKGAFHQDIDRDAPGFKRRAMRALSNALALKRGRPAESNITLAADLHAQGKQWREIYPQCIAAHESLSREAQRIAEENLRAAVRSRRNTRRRRTLVS